MTRIVTEWIGKTDDAAIPARVKIRVFEKHKGKCAITGKRLHPGEWDCDHIVALKDGGEHRESNMQPVWRGAHRKKTANENSARAKVNRVQIKHQLPAMPKTKIQSRGFVSRLKSDDKIARMAAANEAHRNAMSMKMTKGQK